MPAAKKFCTRYGPPKNPEIVQLNSFRKADKAFWNSFPSNSKLTENSSNIDHTLLKKKIVLNKGILSASQFHRGLKAVQYLQKGAPAFQKSSLPSCFVKNDPKTEKNGGLVTDTIATWVKQRIVSGPFDTPPLEKFRVNGLVAIEQAEKIRICLNVSLPENLSFNSNMDSAKLEKVHMSSARAFGYSVMKAGRNATMSKFDLCDAYKNISCLDHDLRLQGFTWLEKFFVENRQIFGAKSSVCNFDIFGNTVKCLALCDCKIKSEFVHRQLDDVPVVGPANSNWCEEYTLSYKKLCSELSIKIANDCPKFEKAFSNSKFGKVLGIFFDSEKLCWSLPEDKKDKALNAIVMCYDSVTVKLVEIQKLVGRLNDVALMCPFLNGFKRPLLDDLCKISETGIGQLSQQTKKDLLIWGGFLTKENSWLPIPPEPSAPPLRTKSFFSDAAGLAVDGDWTTGPGVATVGFTEEGQFLCAHRITWPTEMIRFAKDSKGVRFGDKSTTLEMIGVLLPFIIIPSELKKQHIELSVDNMNCLYGWENRSLKGDISASIVIRAIHLISAYLGSIIHVKHLPRVSNFESSMVDRMSRMSTMAREDRKLLSSFANLRIPPVLLEWICNPSEDWSFPIRLLSYVKYVCEK